MTKERPGAITGVARGGLGTGTALDDTQVYDVADFATPGPAAAPAAVPAAATAPEPAVRSATPRAARRPEQPRPAPAPDRPVAEPVRAVVRERPNRHRPRVPQAGLIAATAVVAVIATAIVSSRLGDGPAAMATSAPEAVAPFGNGETAAPTEASGGGKVDGRGNGKGNGNGGGGH